MDKLKKIELIQRSLGLRHKLKVHESMKPPENHEELAVMLNAKWEFEDEVKAIEEIMNEERAKNVAAKKKLLLSAPLKGPESIYLKAEAEKEDDSIGNQRPDGGKGDSPRPKKKSK